MKKLISLLLVIFVLVLTIFFGIDLAKRSSRLFIKEPHYNYEMAQEMYESINQERADRNINSLSWYDNLEEAAKLRAKELVVKMAHERPDGTPFYTVDDAAMGENIAKGFDDIESVMIGFMDSPSHRDAILSERYNNVSCAVYYVEGTYYFVQLFN